MTTSSSVTLRQHDNGLSEVILNRPDKHNAFDDKLIADLTRLLERLQNHSGTRLLVLRGAGKSFSAGADLNWMKRMADYSWEENYQDSLGLATLMSTLADFSRPTLALVHGATFGGGVGLVACCDFAIASASSKFALSETKLGLIPAVISPYVVSAIGQRNASRFFFSAETFGAATAQSVGLIQHVIADDSFEAESQKFIAQILSNGPEAVYQAKQLIQHVVNKPIDEDLIRETAQKIADIRATAEGREGVTAFLEKRAPKWPEGPSKTPIIEESGDAS